MPARRIWCGSLLAFRSDSQAVPSWTGFNIRTRDQVHVVADVVGYLPTINAPATELNTVFEILNVNVTVDHKCYNISSQGSAEVPALQCNQEEPDGSLLLHAAHAAREE